MEHLALARTLADAIAPERGLILVLTGAGVSLASGIPTFRGSDPEAVWNKDVTELATYGHFQRNPAGSWQWYRSRFASVRHARPNAAHRALAALERWQLERGGRYLLVTQNIDTLHEQAGSIELVKVHGSASRARCSRVTCGVSSTQVVALEQLNFDEFDRDPRRENIPRCSTCGGLMRPHVLWFDELYTSHDDYRWPRVVEASHRMRLVLMVGTSLSVGVTGFLQEVATSRDTPMFLVDPGPRPADAAGSVVHMREKAEVLLPQMCELLMQHTSSS